MWRLVSFSLEKVLDLMQDRGKICAKRTIGSEISLDAPDGLLGDMGELESSFLAV